MNEWFIDGLFILYLTPTHFWDSHWKFKNMLYFLHLFYKCLLNNNLDPWHSLRLSINWWWFRLLSRVWLWDPMNCGNTRGFPVLYHLPEFAQTHVHWVDDTSYHLILSLSFPPSLNFSQHLRLFQWFNFSLWVAKLLELQLQHPSFPWIFRVNFF